MPLRGALVSLWQTVVRGRRLDADLDEELGQYLDARIREREGQGMSHAAARREALMEMGGLDRVKEEVRDVRIGRLVEETLRDVAHAWRGFRKTPGFTAAAVAALALGVGANTAIFSVVHALLLEPLPFRDPSRLVFVWEDQSAEGYPRAPLSGPELNDLRERATRFDGFGGIWATTAALTGDGDPEQLRIGLVTTDFFSILGASAARGRTFAEGDAEKGPPTTILLSAAVWQRRYGGDPAIVGKRIEVNGRPTTVVGVMPEGFRLLMPPDAAVPDDLEAWQPLNRQFPEGPRGQRYLRVVGRMRSSVAFGDARDDIARVGQAISKAYAFYGTAGRQFETVPLQDDVTREVRRPLEVLFAGVGILLLIACVNVANLLVARAAARSRETALKTALGASAGRLVRQHLVESLVLTGMGAATGLVFGRWGLSVLQALAPDALSRLKMASVDLTVAAVSCATVIVWSVLLASVPAFQALRVKVAPALQQGDRRAGGGTRHRVRAMLTVAQLALSVILVVGALLLVRSFLNLQQTDLGFRPDGVMTFRVALPGARYPNQDAFNAFSRRLQTALAALPGVTGVSAMSHAPFDSVPNWGGPYLSVPGADPSTAPQADYRAVAPGLMELLNVRLMEGRTFIESDDHHGDPVVIVDERLARRAWPGQSAIGRRLAVDPAVIGTPSTWTTVVGVVRHVRHRSPVEDVRDQVYFPERQVPRNPFVVMIRTTADPARLAGPMRDTIRRLDAELPIYDVRTLADYAAGARALRAFTMLLASLFAAAALALACLGVYAVVAFSVTQRAHEFGVRLALGAQAGQVMRLVFREGAGLALAGLAVGLAGAAAAAWPLRSQLVGVQPWDAATFATAAPVLGAAALVACLVPALRATRADPVEALKGD